MANSNRLLGMEELKKFLFNRMIAMHINRYLARRVKASCTGVCCFFNPCLTGGLMPDKTCWVK
jgi:hypothetical protein